MYLAIVIVNTNSFWNFTIKWLHEIPEFLIETSAQTFIQINPAFVYRNWCEEKLLSLYNLKNVTVSIQEMKSDLSKLKEACNPDSEIIDFNQILNLLFIIKDIRRIEWWAIEWFYYEPILNFIKTSDTLYSVRFEIESEEMINNFIEALALNKKIEDIELIITDQNISNQVLDQVELYLKNKVFSRNVICSKKEKIT